MSNTPKVSKKPEKKEIYVLLTYPPTLIAKVIGLYTRKSYTHASISLDPEFKQLYSFGRKILYFPLICGFIHENPKGGVYSLSDQISCKVFKIEVTPSQFEMVKQNIEGYIAEKGKYRYNFMGLIGIMLNRRIPVKDSFFCSEFVANVLNDSGIELFDKHSYFVRPDDFLEKDELEEIYCGNLTQYLSSMD